MHSDLRRIVDLWPSSASSLLVSLLATMPLLCFAVGSWRREKWHTVKMKVVVQFWLEMHINFHFTIWVYAQNWIQVKHIIETGSDQFKNLKFDHLVCPDQSIPSQLEVDRDLSVAWKHLIETAFFFQVFGFREIGNWVHHMILHEDCNHPSSFPRSRFSLWFQLANPAQNHLHECCISCRILVWMSF